MMRYLWLCLMLFTAGANAAELVIAASQDDVKNAIITTLTGRDFNLDTESPSHVVFSKPVGGAMLSIMNALAHDDETDSRVQLDFLILKTADGTKVIASKYSATIIGSGKTTREKIPDGDLPDFLNEIKAQLNKQQ